MDPAAADTFNRWLSGHDGHLAKPVMVDVHQGQFPGHHGRDRIQVRVSLSPLERRQVVPHEPAHFRVRGHRRSFTST